MSLINEMMKFVLSYVLVLVIGFFVIQFLSGGFFTKFLKVKGSRGGLVLVNVRSKLIHYFVSGKVEGNFLIFNDKESKANKQKEPKRLALPENNVFYRAYGVNCVNVDESTGAVISPDMTGVTGFDLIKFSNLYTRALYKPTLDKDDTNKILTIIILIAVVLCIVGMVILYIKLGSLEAILGTINRVGGVSV